MASAAQMSYNRVTYDRTPEMMSSQEKVYNIIYKNKILGSQKFQLKPTRQNEENLEI